MQTNKVTDFTRFLTREFRAWEDSQGGKQSVSAWADYLGLKQPTLNRWINGDTVPDAANVALLVERLGPEVYRALAIQAPAEISIEGLPDEFRRKLEGATISARNALVSSGLEPGTDAAAAVVVDAFRAFGFEVMETVAK